MKSVLVAVFAITLTSMTIPTTFTGRTDTWKIVHNGKLLLQSSTEDPSKNTKTIKVADLKKSGYLWINYTENEKQKGWKRIIALFDDNDHELLKHGGNSLRVTNPHLRSLANKYRTIHIYTWSLPTDPKVAATVRVARVHLCTIVLK